jgi:hypothetical protein
VYLQYASTIVVLSKEKNLLIFIIKKTRAVAVLNG